MKDKVALVTGANTGIGFEIARGLLAKGATVVLGCRDLKKGHAAREQLVSLTGNDAAVVMQVDLANLSRLRNFVPKFLARYERLDWLVHNAGVWPRTRRKTEGKEEEQSGKRGEWASDEGRAKRERRRW